MAPPDEPRDDVTNQPTEVLEEAAQRARAQRAAEPRRPALAAGQQIAGRYTIVRFIAAGGMGEVYEAEDRVLGIEVALKIIRPEVAFRERAVERFRREILFARRVTHPNVCRIFDVGHHPAEGDAPGVVFLTMELLRGESLDQILRREGAMTAVAALPLVTQMAAALAAAHEAGIVHRDFKTANVMVIPPRSSETAPRVVVTDFGLARAADTEDYGTLTQPEHLVGTPAYMAPEQIEGGEVGPATDVYALGVVLYEMVTGRRPFVGDSPISTALKRFREAPSSPREHAPSLPSRWAVAILRCLEREPQDRFASATEVVRALAGDTVPTRRRGRRRAFALGAGLTALVAVAAGLLLVPVLRKDGPPSATPAGTFAAAPRRSVAVLGFRNLSGRKDAAWLSTALAEMLTSELAAGETLRTVPGENVARMKIDLSLGEAESLAADSLARIRQHVGADVVVLGSYLAVGDGAARPIRIDLRLQDTAAGETLGSVTETGTEKDILDLVSRTGGRLRQRLGVGDLSATDAGALRASLPSSPVAARFYAEGIASLRRFDALAARSLLEQAVKADEGYAPSHAALAEAWAALGYDAEAADSARRAHERAEGFSREERLVIEGRLREATKDWPKAIEVYRSLWTFFPDDLEHGLRLAAAQSAGGQNEDARATLAALRRLPPPAADDPRVDLAEALAAETLGDFKAERELAARAVAKASARGASLVVARARLAEAWAFRYQGQPREATEAATDARRRYEAAGDRGGVAHALLLVSNGLEDQGDLAGARRAAEEGLSIRRSLGDANGTARMLNSLANVLDLQGELGEARRRREESLSLFKKAGNRNGMAVATFNIANLMAKGGDHDGARARYQEALAAFRELGNRMGIAAATTGLANELKERADLAGAMRLYDEALALNREIGDPSGQAICEANLGVVSLLLGDLAPARKHYEEALRLAGQADNQSLKSTSLTGVAEVLARAGDLAEARRRHEEALKMRTETGEERAAAESRLFLALLSLDEGRVADAEPPSRELPEVFRKLRVPEYEAHSRALRALVLLERGDARGAREEMRRAWSTAGAVAPPELRYVLLVVDARARAAAGDVRGATRALESTAAEARKAGLVGFELDARLALGEVELASGQAEAGRARLAQVESDARARGFGTVANEAARKRGAAVPPRA
jgi:tetratricopeptide (TPR) repeat protein/TolB-like protein